MHGHKAQHAEVWLQAVLPVLQVRGSVVCMHPTCASACISEFSLRRMHPPCSQVACVHARAAVTLQFGTFQSIIQHEPPCSLAGHGCRDGATLCPPDAPPAALAALSRPRDGGGCGRDAAGCSVELLAAHISTRAAHRAAPAGELLCSLSVLRVADRDPVVGNCSLGSRQAPA